jgi:adenosylhomocysteine nucleosidase
VSPAAPPRPFASPVARTAVITALEIEARTLDGFGREPDLLVCLSGPGPERAFAAARSAVAAGAEALLSWGIAGALSSERRTGDVLLPARVLSATGEWATDAAWRRRVATMAARQFVVSEDPLYSAEHVVSGAGARAELAGRTGAVAVDMESAAVAQAAAEAGIPCIAIRVVADGPDDSLPDGIESLVTREGRTRYPGLWRLLLRPSQLPLLFELARRSRAACRVLRTAAVDLAGRAA